MGLSSPNLDICQVSVISGKPNEHQITHMFSDKTRTVFTLSCILPASLALLTVEYS